MLIKWLKDIHCFPSILANKGLKLIKVKENKRKERKKEVLRKEIKKLRNFDH